MFLSLPMTYLLGYLLISNGGTRYTLGKHGARARGNRDVDGLIMRSKEKRVGRRPGLKAV